MKIEQFEDKELSHYSYAILSETTGEVILVDPSRDVAPYLAFAEQHHATIIGVIETHPHADFVSGHLELHHLTGATIYCSALVGAKYPHQPFDEGNAICFGDVKLKCLNTPGHSPDSISIVLEQDGDDKAVFTGDTLFIGDCGRPDLRETAGNVRAKREELAVLMYRSLRKKLLVLNDNVVVYPAHGAGTLCGKALSKANCSTIGAEKTGNWSLMQMTEGEFVAELLKDQPFIPKYFPYDVEVNKQGAGSLAASLAAVNRLTDVKLDNGIMIIDTRAEAIFNTGHLHGSINLQAAGKFETWLGSIIAPGEAYYLVSDSNSDLEKILLRCAKIGYESAVKGAFVLQGGEQLTPDLDLRQFKAKPEIYTIIDVRNESEVKEGKVFNNAINIPLPELRERVGEIPINKPIVVHCAGGYRSAAGYGIINNTYRSMTTIYNLGKSITEFV
ncbi:MBL fold metallo-hydrolase [Mucilaginibacter terrae]|uniref:Hydroxyacylglutathione hydrolase n=1 Tax=Mucilaginibacter terrae TaxID=1955052 RepID=A0ABU3H2B2_9SPHI|nr:MBL fold metallo-hydrolase [Mucilaginibacter terrae]MDT3405397.1 hydroxyacylglutathione hydrolase [Mucilaginibacter terrae]